jgi:hypothetical protein
MRSFYFLAAAALLASPILAGRQVTVDSDKLQALIKAADDLRATLGYDFTKGTTTTTNNGNSKDALVVDTIPATGTTTDFNDISCKACFLPPTHQNKAALFSVYANGLFLLMIDYYYDYTERRPQVH